HTRPEGIVRPYGTPSHAHHVHITRHRLGGQRTRRVRATLQSRVPAPRSRHRVAATRARSREGSSRQRISCRVSSTAVPAGARPLPLRCFTISAPTGSSGAVAVSERFLVKAIIVSACVGRTRTFGLPSSRRARRLRVKACPRCPPP